MPEFVLALKFALFSLSKLTPFAWLAVLGAALAVLGAAPVLLAMMALGSQTRYRPLRPYELPFRGFIENSFYVFLAGVILLLVGIYPFVVAAQR